MPHKKDLYERKTNNLRKFISFLFCESILVFKRLLDISIETLELISMQKSSLTSYKAAWANANSFAILFRNFFSFSSILRKIFRWMLLTSSLSKASCNFDLKIKDGMISSSLHVSKKHMSASFLLSEQNTFAYRLNEFE